MIHYRALFEDLLSLGVQETHNKHHKEIRREA
jgi:hypothetical protein